MADDEDTANYQMTPKGRDIYNSNFQMTTKGQEAFGLAKLPGEDNSNFPDNN